MLQIQALSNPMIAQIYERHMQKDFPASELKSLSHMLDLIAQGIYKGYGLFEDETLCAYAFLTHAPSNPILLLDYLAVCAHLRNRHYGSQFLTLLNDHFAQEAGILIEIESIASASHPLETELRTKRLLFYKRNGAIETQVVSNCFGVEFSILYLGTKQNYSQETVAQDLDAIYKAIFSPHHYQTQVQFISPQLAKS